MQKVLNLCLITLFVSLPLPAEAQEEKGRAYYDFGVFAYEDGDYGDAGKKFLKRRLI